MVDNNVQLSKRAKKDLRRIFESSGWRVTFDDQAEAMIVNKGDFREVITYEKILRYEGSIRAKPDSRG